MKSMPASFQAKSPSSTEAATDALLIRWRVITVSLLVIGYAGYYLCRSDLSVVLPLLTAELGAKGIAPDVAKIQLGTIASWGVFAYAVGKFPAGWLADFLGGRRSFLLGMGGAALFTVLFGFAGGIPLFTFAWMCNRLIQSTGWAGMVKITSRWFSYSSYGTVMGIVSLSYLFGDAASREFMSLLIRGGLGWRGVFFTAAATLGALLILNIILLMETPQRIGRPEPPTNPANLFGDDGKKTEPESVGSLLKTFGASRVFWLVCLLSCGLTILRETFNLWTPTYFTESVGLSVADAAQKSALFPLFGGISVILAGVLSDRFGAGGRAAIILYGMLLSSLVLLVLAFGSFGESPMMPVALVALVAFLVIGPYSYLAGAIALDFGGKMGSGTASGLIDCAGYLGGVFAGSSFAGVSVRWGWRGGFTCLAAIALLSSAAAYFYLRDLYLRDQGPATRKI